MALPLIAAGIAARAVAKKLASRAAGGITGAGAKQVNTVYRNMGTGSVKVIPQSSISKTRAENVTAYKTQRVNDAKSGVAAKRAAKNQETRNLQGILSGKTGDPKVIKINSNPTRSR
jgi:hypothetical protein